MHSYTRAKTYTYRYTYIYYINTILIYYIYNVLNYIFNFIQLFSNMLIL